MSGLFGDCNWGKIEFQNMAVLVFFWGFIGHKIVNISPFNLKISLPIDLDLNDGQNKNQAHISEAVTKISNF